MPSAHGRAAVAAALRSARTVLLTSHENGDGDGIGSALGVARALRRMGARAEAAFPTPVPANLRFLPGAGDAAVVDAGSPLPADLASPDLVVAFDCAAEGRLGALLPAARAARGFANVDHHASNEGFGTVRWIDPAYAAAGTMAFDLLGDLGAPLDRETALCLYTALATDTGNFAYSNTDPRSHRMAAACLEAGARAEEVTAALHRGRSAGSWRVEAEAVARLESTPDGAVAWTTVTRRSLLDHGVAPGDAPDLVEIPVSLAATRVAFLLTEAEDGRGTRVSLRSRCAVGVHEIARRFGGGGHPRAAGFTHPGTPGEARDAVLAAVRDALDAAGGLPPQDA